MCGIKVSIVFCRQKLIFHEVFVISHVSVFQVNAEHVGLSLLLRRSSRHTLSVQETFMTSRKPKLSHVKQVVVCVMAAGHKMLTSTSWIMAGFRFPTTLRTIVTLFWK